MRPLTKHHVMGAVIVGTYLVLDALASQYAHHERSTALREGLYDQQERLMTQACGGIEELFAKIPRR